VISEAYQHEKNVYTALRMLDAVNILLRDNKEFIRAMKEVNKKAKFNTGSVYAWSNYTVWKQFCNTIIKDKRAIDSVSRLTGVESRIIVMCVVGEQLRMFNSGREKFKQYVYPYSRLILPSNRGYGVSGILEHTALRIESTLFNEKDPFYPGDYFQQTINVRDSFPEVINDSISAHRHKTIQRLIKGGDHYYSYLYTAYLMRQFQAHWERNNFDLSNRPEILGTLFNLGYQKSKPKKNPEVGGSTFKIGEKDYTFGGLCFEFYYSGEMQDAFPITGRGFIPVKELEKNNKTWIEAIKKRIEEEEKARLEAEEDAALK
jgi:antitoxin component of RelBE/YafQ-DinJ toxin-antitoxin module